MIGWGEFGVTQSGAVVLEAPREKIHDQAFNVGRPGENYRIRTVAEIVESIVPGSKISFAEGAGADPRCYKVDFDKLARILPEFEPAWNVERGVHQLLEAYRRENLTRDELEGDLFVRMQTILRLLREGRLDDDLRWLTA